MAEYLDFEPTASFPHPGPKTAHLVLYPVLISEDAWPFSGLTHCLSSPSTRAPREAPLLALRWTVSPSLVYEHTHRGVACGLYTRTLRGPHTASLRSSTGRWETPSSEGAFRFPRDISSKGSWIRLTYLFNSSPTSLSAGANHANPYLSKSIGNSWTSLKTVKLNHSQPGGITLTRKGTGGTWLVLTFNLLALHKCGAGLAWKRGRESLATM